MIKIKVDGPVVDGGMVEGDIVTITAETMLLIHTIYNKLFEESTHAAMMYRDALEDNISAAFTLDKYSNKKGE